MKVNILWISMIALLSLNLFAGEMKWQDDFNATLKQAKEEDKLVLVNFSGSDWCYWCKKLSNEVFSKDDFKTYAKDNLVLFIADFPKGTQQSQVLKAQNENLARKYGVRGFPTIFLLDGDGNTVAQTGYQEGGAANYVKHIETLKKGKFK